MTKTEIIYNNELIAKFMGWKLYKPKYKGVVGFFLNVYSKEHWYKDVDNDLTWRFTLEHMKYHNSWDWIMSVVLDIESKGYYALIGDHGMDILQKGSYIGDYKHGTIYGDSKFDGVYKQVITFIKWYNNKKF